MKTSKKYLPLNKFHIVKIGSLKPDDIKTSAKYAIKDREKIGHTTILNAIVKSLGFKGGIAEYATHFDASLKPFMKKHDLKHQADLFTPRKKDGVEFIPDVKPQDLSERIFYSGLEIPEKIFTGYNHDFSSIYDGFYVANNLIDSCGLMVGDSDVVIRNNIKLAEEYPNKLVTVYDGTKRKLIDVVTGGFTLGCDTTGNLIGDSLCKPVKLEPVVKLYANNSYEQLSEDKERHILMFSLFRQRIDKSDLGWVDVIQFNENLVFLKGTDGEYDYVFKNQRDHIFKHEVYSRALKIADIPSFIEDYSFSRWEYFEHRGWRENERHEAENLFYNSGGVCAKYPGQDVILRDYYELNKLYQPKKKNKSNQYHKDFISVSINKKPLAVSNLITIAEFDEFKKERIDYMDYRIGDSLSSNNSEQDKSLPVTLTWYDALVYAKWFQDKTHLPVRLMTLPEYLILREDLSGSMKSNESSEEDGLTFYNDKGEPYESHPPHMNNDDFDSLVCKYSQPIKKYTLDNKLAFYSSNHIAEWIMEKTCIRSGNLKSFYNDEYVLRSSPPLYSTGKYKHLKIVFRLCYELDS